MREIDGVIKIRGVLLFVLFVILLPSVSSQLQINLKAPRLQAPSAVSLTAGKIAQFAGLFCL